MHKQHQSQTNSKTNVPGCSNPDLHETNGSNQLLNQENHVKIKTEKLTGRALDLAVAKCEGLSDCEFHYYYSTDWVRGGPIVECHDISIVYSGGGEWKAYRSALAEYVGATPLEAALRCYAATVLGEEVEIPNVLIG